MSKKDVLSYRERHQAALANATPKSKATAKVAKTAKGQRAAAKRAESAFVPLRKLHEEHCVDGFIVIDESNSSEVCKYCVPAQTHEQLAWAFPVSEAQWLKSVAKADESITGKSLYETVPQSYEQALETARLRTAYKAYERSVWESHVTLDSFEKIAATQVAREKRGGANLGLLGYSAIDIAQKAWHNAWVRKVVRYFTQIGASPTDAKALSQALRDDRSYDQLVEDAKLGSKKRMVVHNDTTAKLGFRIRFEDQAAAVTRARLMVAALDEFKAQVAAGLDTTSFNPGMGDVYREIKGVLYEGIRKFNNTLEGLTPEGHITDNVYFTKVKATGFISIDDALFTEHVFNEEELRRQAIVDVLMNNLPSMVPAEITSVFLLSCLYDGLSGEEAAEELELTPRKFTEAVKAATALVADISTRKVERRINQLKAELLAA